MPSHELHVFYTDAYRVPRRAYLCVICDCYISNTIIRTLLSTDIFNNNKNNNNSIYIAVGLFCYQSHNHGEKYKVTRVNGQTIRCRQITSGELIIRLVITQNSVLLREIIFKKCMYPTHMATVRRIHREIFSDR